MVMHNEGLFPVMSCLMLVGNGLSVSVRARAQSHYHYLSEPQYSSSLKMTIIVYVLSILPSKIYRFTYKVLCNE